MTVLILNFKFPKWFDCRLQLAVVLAKVRMVAKDTVETALGIVADCCQECFCHSCLIVLHIFVILDFYSSSWPIACLPHVE
jgi:hypothetical protein